MKCGSPAREVEYDHVTASLWDETGYWRPHWRESAEGELPGIECMSGTEHEDVDVRSCEEVERVVLVREGLLQGRKSYRQLAALHAGVDCAELDDSTNLGVTMKTQNCIIRTKEQEPYLGGYMKMPFSWTGSADCGIQNISFSVCRSHIGLIWVDLGAYPRNDKNWVDRRRVHYSRLVKSVRAADIRIGVPNVGCFNT